LKKLPLKAQKILHGVHTPPIPKAEWSLDSLDVLILTLRETSVREVFTGKAIGFGHQPSEAKQMHANLVRFLAGEYQRALND
jgi:hypothetical protein